MVNYSCEDCGKEYSQKSHYDSHKRRKKPCKKEINRINILEEKIEKLEKIIINNNTSTYTVLNDYNTLKNYYNNNLNVDKSLVVTSNDEPTPIECVEEMVNVIDDQFWKNNNLKILDPCCGCGNFFLVILQKLKKYHSLQHILENMLYFNDINIDRINIVKKVFLNDTYNINITTENFLDYNPTLKYNLIVANPPYAKLLPNGKRASKNHNLIGVFINKSLELLEDKGLLLYITPNNWMSCADRNILIKELTKKQILYLDIHTAKKYFKKIGSSFTWYLIENTPSYKDIAINCLWKKKLYKDTIRSEERSYIPLLYNKIIQNILHKTTDNTTHERFNVQTSSDLHKYTKKSCISKTPDETFKYKLIHTPSQTVWANRPHKYQDGYKIFISTTSYYKIFIDKCGMTQSIAFIQCSNEDEANQLKQILEHPLYVFINNICRWGNFNNVRILQKFPKPNVDNVQDKEVIYNYFNITKEEQSFIENHV